MKSRQPRTIRSSDRKHSITRNLAAGLLLALSCIAGITLYANAALSSRQADAELEARLAEYAGALADSLEVPLWDYAQRQIDSIGRAYAANDLVAHLTITALPNPNPVFEFQRPGQTAVLSQTFPVQRDEKTLGIVDLGLSHHMYRKAGRRFFTAYLLSMLLMAGSLTLVSTLLLRRLLQQPFAGFIELVNAYAAGEEHAFSREIAYREFSPLITVLQQMGQTISLQMQGLREAEQKYRRIFDNAVMGIFQTTPDGHILAANQAFAHLLGYASPEELLEEVQDVRRQLYIHPERHAEFMQRLACNQSLSGFEVEFSRKDGSRIWVSLDARSVCANKQVLRYYEGFLQDITLRKQAEVRLREYQEHLEELVKERTRELEDEIVERMQIEKALEDAKDEAVEALRSAEEAQQAAEDARKTAENASRSKSMFLANMSHELRTPLNAILGFTQLLRRDLGIPASQQHRLESIMRSGEHLLMLINDVLDMAKIESGRIVLNPQDFDLGHTLSTIEDMMTVRAEKKGLRLHVSCDPEVPQHIKADENKLRQVLINLLGNAIKFTEQGTVSLHVGLGDRTSSADSIQLCFSVSDTGMGILPNQQETIFKAFERAPHISTQIEGAGLGLAISRQIVRLMGGDIDVHSAEGQGATFTFTIQTTVAACREGAFVANRKHRARKVTGLLGSQPAPRILIVENDPESRVFLTELLRSVGFAVCEAMNGREAIEQWQAWGPHVIFMDIRMPFMNGYEATRAIRTIEGRKAVEERPVTIVAVTSHAFEDDARTASEYGCDSFLRKPVQEQQIFDCIQTYLDVDYVYQTEPDTQTSNAAARNMGRKEPEDIPAMLAKLPADLLGALEQAAINLDIAQLGRIHDSIQGIDPTLAEILERLARDLRCQDIWELVRESKNL